MGVYCGDVDRCYLLPIESVAGRSSIHLRLAPPLNGQRASIHFASAYEFAGAVAQWEERRRGTAEAAGSSPASSTPDEPARPVTIEVGAHLFRNHFGYYMERAAAGDEILISRRGKPHSRLGPPQSQLPLAA